MSSEKPPTTYVEIETPDADTVSVSISVSGHNSALLKKPEMIRKIMEVLELPAGTRARIVSVAGDVIVR
jgi:hypothetical protein